MSLPAQALMKRTLVAIALRVSRDSRLSLPSPTSTQLFSTFKPADPPGTFGTPVFSDIDFSVRTDPASESALRNNDPSAVFVVTGASRGIGLQFCKSLVDRTQVSSAESVT